MKIESHLAEIAVAIIVAGEAAYRGSLRVEIERIEQAVRISDECRQRLLAEANAARLAALHRSGELLRQAQDIRLLIASVKNAIMAGARDMSSDDLIEWEDWANEVADGLDPVKSGQVDAHLCKPAIES